MDEPGKRKTKAEEVRDAILGFLDIIDKMASEDPAFSRLKEIVYVMMIVFSDDPEQVRFRSEREIAGFVPLSDIDRSMIKPTTKMISTSNVTCMYKALRMAKDALVNFMDKTKGFEVYRPSVVLLSDGCENCDQTKFLEEAEDLRTLYRVFVVQYGRSGNICPDLLKEAASEINQEELDRAVRKLGDLQILKQLAKDDRFFFEVLGEDVLKILLIGATTISQLAAVEG